jgi:protein gp37
MSENSRISWTTHTFNPWLGCTEVDQECTNCYARELAQRYGWVQWGQGQPRRRTSDANWHQPLRWNRQAAEQGIRPRVFCASLADVFDAEVPPEWRTDLWALIRATPQLDWLLLTKRPNLLRRYLPADWGDGWPHVWLGTTVGHQGAAWRIRHLLAAPAVVRFLSCEPLLGPLDLGLEYIECDDDGESFYWHDPRDSHPCDFSCRGFPTTGLHWVIGGGESGPQRRPMDWAWARDLRDQCVAAGVPFWWKQGPALRPGQDATLDDEIWHQLPTPRVAVPA